MTSETKKLFLPESWAQLSRRDVSRWYDNIPRELQHSPLNGNERRKLRNYYVEAGLLSPWKRKFFDHHYARPLWKAVHELFGDCTSPRILDLGCGSGTQSLLFALLGASVIGVDMDGEALSVFRKRIAFYERATGRPLDVQVVQADVFTIDWTPFAPFQGVYSLFAFNMMQPSSTLIARLGACMPSRGVFFIQDGNRNHFFNRLFRRRNVASAGELREIFEDSGFRALEQRGAYAIPPIIWALAPSRCLRPLDDWLNRHEFLAVSHLHVARKS